MAPVPIRAGSRAGDSLPLPAGALLCPLQCGVFCVCFQVLVTCPECFWGSCCAGRQRVALQPQPGAALRCACLPSKGVSEPRYYRDGPSRPHQSSHRLLVESALILDSHRLLMESALILDIVCHHVFLPGRSIPRSRETGVYQPFPRAVPAALCWEGNQVQKTLITATPQIIKSVKYLYCHQVFVFVLPPNRDGIIHHIKLKVIIFFKEIIKSLTLSAYSAD